MILRFFKSLYLTNRLLIILIGLVISFILGFAYIEVFAITKLLLLSLAGVLLIDILLLYFKKQGIEGERLMTDRFSNGDKNGVLLKIKNHYPFPLFGRVTEELPFQFQQRDQSLNLKLGTRNTELIEYHLIPKERGEYTFGKTNIAISTVFGLIRRRYTLDTTHTIKVYPSFLQMKKYTLLAFSNKIQDAGIKKIRRIGHNKEFEQIRDYVQGDDIRSINWKATARRNSIMVNQYEDERSQQVFCMIDKGRSMKMPFEGMTLMDYAINASLVMSNITIHKHDKAGLITFSNRMGVILPASNKAVQMNTIQEQLYNQKTRHQESDYGRLFRNIKWNIKRRSLLLLFTNFESVVSLRRQIPYLRSIAKDHLLVVILFKNSELYATELSSANNMTEIYENTIAEKFIYEKELITKELSKYGIQSILTEPENLTVNTINKYLEIKSRGLI